MFLVTMLRPASHCIPHYLHKVRRMFNSLHDAEEFCDHYENNGWTIISLEICDYSLSPLLEACED